MRRLAWLLLLTGCAATAPAPPVVRRADPPPLLLRRDQFAAHEALAPITTLTTSVATLLRLSATFVDTPLPLAVGFLSDVTGLTLKVSPTLEHVRVTAQLREVTLLQALEAVAAQADLELHAFDDCVLLAARGEPAWVREHHDVRDVVGASPDALDAEALVAIVRRGCGPDAWAAPAAVQFEAGHLVVDQTPTLQARVREVLADLRQRLYVVVQVTSLETSDEALASIGVEWAARRGCEGSVTFDAAPLEPFQVRVIGDAIAIEPWHRPRTYVPIFVLGHRQRGRLLVRKAGPEEVVLDLLPTIVDETRAVRLDLCVGSPKAEAYTTVTQRDGGAVLLRFGEGGSRRWFFVEVKTISLRDEDVKRFKIDDE